MKLSNFSLDFFFKRYAEYIGKDAKVETLLILMIMSSDLVELTISEYYSIYLFALLLEVAFNCNTLFLWAVWTMAPNWVFSVLTLAASALSCNKKWKIYLFMFVSIISMGKESKNSHLITALASLFLTVLSYSSLIFQTVTENSIYFTFFFLSSAAYGVVSAAELLYLQLQLPLLLFLVVASIALAQKLINQKIQNIRGGIQKLRDPHVTTLCLIMISEQLSCSKLASVEFKLHIKQCVNPLCFCKNEEEAGVEAYFREVLEDAIRRFGEDDDPLLNQMYIDHLLTTSQIIKAVYFLGIWKPQSYFTWTVKHHCEAKVIAAHCSADLINSYEREYQYALEYDNICLRLFTETSEVLYLKVAFWKEVARVEPRLDVLQKIGGEATDRMFALNEFYGESVKKYEEILYSYDGTALYVTYLISATSFKSYSKELIKRMTKMVEDIDLGLGDSPVSEIFCLQTMVRKDKMSYVGDESPLTDSKRLNSPQHQLEKESNGYKQIISRVSHGFCRLLKLEKHMLVGSDLNTIIPNGYKEAHEIRLSYILDLESEINKKIAPSKFFHQESFLPIKGVNEELHNGNICVRFHIDIEHGLSFIATIKKVPSQNVSALLNFDGTLREKEQGFPREALQHSDTQEYLSQLRRQWREERIVKKERFSVMLKGVNYEITLSSPLLNLFPDSENMESVDPPIHIDIKDSKTSKGVYARQEANRNKQNMKASNKLILQDRGQSVTSTKKTVTSAVNILQSFSENSSVPYYRLAIFGFMVIIGLCLAGTVVVVKYPSLEWDNSKVTANPILQFCSLNDVLFAGLRSQVNILDAKSYFKHLKVLNMTRVNSYESSHNYEHEITLLFKETEADLRFALINILGQSSRLMGNFIESIFEKVIPVSNMGTLTVGNAAGAVSKQSLTYRQLQMICITDYNYLQKRKQFDYILVSLFSAEVVPYVSRRAVSGLNQDITDSIDRSVKATKEFGVIMATCISVLVLPIFLILRQRYALHERIFDLMTSVDAEELADEIRSLLYMDNIVKNYQDSRDTIKNNVLGYQQNKIIPSSNSSRRRSVSNQLVIGLEDLQLDGVPADLQLDGVIPAEKRVLQQEDEEQEEEEELLIPTNRSLFPDFQSRRKISLGEQSVFSLIRKRMTSQSRSQLLLKKRKRMGQLVIGGSEYDPLSRMVSKHCVFYLFVVLFVALGVHACIINEESTVIAQETHDILNLIYKSVFSTHAQMKKMQYYLWEGAAVYSSLYRVKNVTSKLIKTLDKVVQYKAFNGTEASPIPACTDNYNKICQEISSIRTIEGELESVMQSLIYKKLRDSTNNVTANQLDIFERIFYAQRLASRLATISTQLRKYFLDRMVAESVKNDDYRRLLMMAAVFLASISVAVGMYLLVDMKKQYLKQVYMLSFLNQTMIMKNKRIESYLDTLSKIK